LDSVALKREYFAGIQQILGIEGALDPAHLLDRVTQLGQVGFNRKSRKAE